MTVAAVGASIDQRLLDNYIDGAFVQGSGDGFVEVVNPATAQVVVRVPRCAPSDADRAITAARRAFDEGPWPRLPRKERARILRGFAEALDRHAADIGELVVTQGGCTVAQTENMQVAFPIKAMYEYAELAGRDPVEWVDIAGGAFEGSVPGVGHTVVIREPVGVVAAITPFNYPFMLNVHKVGAALAAGCTVVLKPTEYTCLDAALIARIIDEETEIPAGVVNVLVGATGDVGAMLTSDPRVDHVSFTGSTATGRAVMASAASTLKSVTLELGGKNANIIFADADLDAALAGDCGLVIRHAGQGCAALSRVLVEESIKDEVVARMKARAESVIVGDPTDHATEMGPLVSRAQWERVRGYIASGVEEGATLVSGGGVPSHCEAGDFLEPTIFSDVTPSMRIAREEIFGPVVVVQTFKNEDEAVRLANDTDYGLVGSVWSGELSRALRVAWRSAPEPSMPTALAAARRARRMAATSRAG
ncbi:aldehyde dehydrogenase family protein [Streptomyces sp. GD-15H]